jgi:hypothetical protein
MMVPTVVRVATVKATGLRYIVKAMEYTRVRCNGDVYQVSGASVRHGPDKLFLLGRVDIAEVERDKGLLFSLWQQNKDSWNAHLDQIARKKRQAEWEKWLIEEPDPFSPWGKRLLLSEFAMVHFKKQGYELGLAEIGNTIEREHLQDAACDLASYDYELSRFGIREGPGVHIREMAADSVYEGLCQALEERDAQQAGNTIPLK